MRYERSLKERAFNLGFAVLKLYPNIAAFGIPHRDIATQLTRAATSIGAHLEEGTVAASRRDMANKQAIGLREARETRHWLRLLIADGKLVAELTPHYNESGEIVAMLTASVRKLRGPQNCD